MTTSERKPRTILTATIAFGSESACIRAFGQLSRAIDQMRGTKFSEICRRRAPDQEPRASAFPFDRGDYVQHSGGSGDIFHVVLVDDLKQEAYGENINTGPGCGTRIIHPANWKKVDRPR
jgi:hypothetical protein